MKIITGLSEQPKQQSTLVLADGTRAVWSISYVAQQTGWFYDLSWNGTVIATGQRMVSSPNILRQYINKISFGIAVISPNQLEPTTQTALVDGTVTCYLLEGTDLQTIETTLFNAPAGQVQPVATTSAGAPVVVLPANWGPAGGDLAYAYPNPQVVAMHDGTGQRLAFGTVADNQFLKRVGATVVGATVAPGTGDVVGPASSTIGNVALWADAAGTEISDGGTLGTAAFLPSSNFLGATAAASGDLSGNYPSPRVAAIHTTTGGGTKLTIGAVADGEFLVRSGSTLIGSVPSGAGDVFGPSSTVTIGTVALFATTDGKTLGPSAITLGTIASQAANNVSITGGSIAGAAITAGAGGTINGVPINGSTIGAITASSGRFNSVVSTGGISAATTITATGNIGAANFSGSSSGTNTGDQTTITGNAGTATALVNTRTIGGSNFNGTANVTSFPVPGPIGVTTPAAANFTSIGVTTQGTAAFTTLSATGEITANTNILLKSGNDLRLYNTANDAFSQLYNPGGGGAHQLAVRLNGINVGTFSSTGLAVTGALSSTNSIGARSGGALQLWDSANTDYSYIQNNGSSAATQTIIYTSFGSGSVAHQFRTYSGAVINALNITPAGNVGIGTTSPAYKLQVAGTAGEVAEFTSSNVGTAVRINNTNAAGWGSNISFNTNGTAAGFLGSIGSLIGSTAQDLAIYATAGNGFRVYTNGNNERLRVDSSGNVGIGTTYIPSASGVCKIVVGSPGASSYSTYANPASATNLAFINSVNNSSDSFLTMLDIGGLTGQTDASNGGSAIRFLTQPKVSPFAAIERVRIDSSGNLLVGTTTSNTGNINGSVFYGGADAGIIYLQRQTGTDQMRFYVGGNRIGQLNTGSSVLTLGTANYPLAFSTNDTERMRIDSSGNVRFNAYGAGALTTDASGNITAASDERIKSNIRPFSRGLAEILAVNPILHGYTEESGLDQTRDDYAGFSAQQVQTIIPEAIGANADGMLSFSDRPVMAALVNAVKELSARLAALESK
jgi:hypothetical protein